MNSENEFRSDREALERETRIKKRSRKFKKLKKEHCQLALDVLKEYGELSMRDWAEKMGYQYDIIRFKYLRQKTMEYFKENIGIKGSRRSTRYYYINTDNVPLKMPRAKDIKIINSRIVGKKKKSSKKEEELIASKPELERIFETMCCNFNGDCNLKNIEPIFCTFCSHQIRIPIPETVRSNRTIAILEAKLERLTQE